jgi:ketosteroid isomerase-like protein
LDRTPTETVRELVDRVTRLRNGDHGQVDPLANLYAVDAHVTHPFHPELADTATIGRDALRTHFAMVAQADVSVKSSVEDFRVHVTTDPEVVIAEFRYAGHVGQRPLNTRCIFVVRGLIVESRDYIDHLASARAYGMLPEVLSRLSRSSGP